MSPIELLDVPDGHLLLQTLRSHDQFNTTIYGLSDRYRGIEGGRRVVFVHREDIARARLRPRRRGGHRQPVGGRRPDPRGAGLPARGVRHPARLGGGVLPGDQPVVPLDDTAPGSNQPDYKSLVVRLVPEGTGAHETTATARTPDADWDHKSDPEPRHMS